MEFMSGEWFGRLLGVLVVNLILSGDNAVVIAMAARTLEGANRKKAIIWGAAGAVILRLLFAGVITLLLEVPLLQVVGGLLLVWIAWKLIHEDDGGEGDEEKVKAGSSTWQAVRIIIVADAVMSLDNVIALVQAARIGGQVDISLLVIGLATTIPLVIFGAALLTSLLNRFPFLVYAGAGLLIYLAVEMLFADKVTHPYLKHYHSIEWIIGLAAAVIFMLVAWLWARRSSSEDAG
jgi:YjbE family integral membrane protein